MTPEQQRIAIAEACGWTNNPRPDSGKPSWRKQGEFVATSPEHLPNYPADLNAMHAAEQSLNYRQAMEYVRELEQKCWHRDGEANDGTLSLVRATAAQRAEAFLRTLNLWTPCAT